jgi:hypothetical protein
MCLEPLSQLLIVMALLGQASTEGSGQANAQTPIAANAAAPQPTLPELIVTRHPVFVINYDVTPTTDLAHQPDQIQLFVSNDRGSSWQLYAKSPANSPNQQFTFRANGDGEYWFILRTLDRSGQLRPETITAPGMRVQIDTHAPEMKLTTQVVQPRQVMVRWEADKQALKPESLNIQYRALPKGSWQTVLINSQEGNVKNTAGKGEAVILLKPGENDIQIRGEVSDTAGNLGFGHAQVLASEVQNSLPNSVAFPVQSTIPASQATVSSIVSRNATNATNTTAAENNIANNMTNNADPQGSVAININPAIGSQVVAVNGAGGSWASIPGLPPGEHPRMVNSRLFELEYDIESVGPSGIGKVELWDTRDGGRTWQSYMVDNEHHCPLPVTVEEEGIYGFRVVVTNGAGIGGQPPKNGDLPDIWVGVDLTKPSARILSAQQGTGGDSNNLIITWEASDRMPAARPISLSFSSNISGPWSPIASGLENTGRYAWPIDAHASQIYVRLEVRDAAGNVGVFTTPDPITVDHSQPSVRIRDVRSLGHTGARPAENSTR